jgi:hypothetical protein
MEVTVVTGVVFIHVPVLLDNYGDGSRLRGA